MDTITRGARLPDGQSPTAPSQYSKRRDGAGWDAITPTGTRCFLPPELVKEHAPSEREPLGAISVEAVEVRKDHAPRKAREDDPDDAPKVTSTVLYRGLIRDGVWQTL